MRTKRKKQFPSNKEAFKNDPLNKGTGVMRYR